MDAVNYKNGQKNTWRRQVWNRVSEVIDSRKSAIILYLPGEMDLDVFIAQRHGFHRNNMIAVESNREVVKKLRENKRTVIHGDLLSVMANWPATKPVSLVLADLQCGFTESAMAIFSIWRGLQAFTGSVLMMNMQRGRERPNDGAYMSMQIGVINNPQWEKEDAVNRAKNLLFGALTSIATTAGLSSMSEASMYVGWRLLPSYKSTPKSPYFDSFLIKDRGIPNRLPSVAEFLKSIVVDGLTDGTIKESPEMRRKISAALALRTMRREGALAF